MNKQGVQPHDFSMEVGEAVGMMSFYRSPLWYPACSVQQFHLKMVINILNLTFPVVIVITSFFI